MAAAKNNKYRKGQYLIAKYEGTGGDLIIGKIESVRHNGDITGVNLLTGNKFRKNVEVLDKRNIICPKRIADAIMREAMGDKLIARREAIAYAQLLAGRMEPATVPTSDRKIEKVVEAFKKLTATQQQLALPGIFGLSATVAPTSSATPRRRTRRTGGEGAGPLA